MDFKEYLENIKNRLDSMNRASGFNPQGNNISKYDNYNPGNDVIGGIGAAGKAWMESHPYNPQEMPQIPSPNLSLIFKQ